MAVNPQTGEQKAPRPSDLRALFARHDIPHAEVARRRGCKPQAVNAALRADLTNRPISPQLLLDLWRIASEIILERETCECEGRTN